MPRTWLGWAALLSLCGCARSVAPPSPDGDLLDVLEFQDHPDQEVISDAADVLEDESLPDVFYPRSPARRLSCAAKQCALVTPGGSIYVWGEGAYQIPATGITTRQVTGIDDAVEVEAGGNFFCAIRRNRHLACWGVANYGSLGLGRPTAGFVPPSEPVGLGEVDSVLKGRYDGAMGVIAAGRVWSWGGNANGGIFPSGPFFIESPMQVPNLTDIVEGSRDNATHVRDKWGRVWEWGPQNVNWDVITSAGPIILTQPTSVAALHDIVTVGDADICSCVEKADRSIQCWAEYPAIGLRGHPMTMHGGPYLDWSNLCDTDSGIFCGVRQDHRVECWGTQGREGRMPDHIPFNSTSPWTVEGIDDAVEVEVESGFNPFFPHVYNVWILRENGTVSCWGNNSAGELGQQDRTDRDMPVSVLGLP